MAIDKDDLERSRYEEQYRKELEEMRRKSRAKTQESIEQQTAALGKARQRYHQAEHDFKEAMHQHNRIHSTESTAAVIWAFEESLKAIGGMQAGLIEIARRKAWLKISQTFNYNSEAAPLLMMAAEAARTAPRSTRQFFDKHLGTGLENYFREPLPPAIIPYLAEVDEHGVLKCDLLENEQLYKEDERMLQGRPPKNEREEFVGRYQASFRDAILRGMRESRNTDNEPMYDIDTTNPDAPIIMNHATGEPLTPAEFAHFRETVLTQKLTQEFGEQFRAEGPAAPRMGG